MDLSKLGMNIAILELTLKIVAARLEGEVVSQNNVQDAWEETHRALRELRRMKADLEEGA